MKQYLLNKYPITAGQAEEIEVEYNSFVSKTNSNIAIDEFMKRMYGSGMFDLSKAVIPESYSFASQPKKIPQKE